MIRGMLTADYQRLFRLFYSQDKKSLFIGLSNDGNLREPGIADKSRDMGMSWLTVAIACTVCLFTNDVSVGFGSRKEEYVDRIGDPKCLLYKGRKFIAGLPKEFRGSWDPKKHAPHMRISFPRNGFDYLG